MRKNKNFYDREKYILSLVNPKKNDKILNLGISNIPEIEIALEKKIKECWSLDIDTEKMANAKKYLKKTKVINLNIEKNKFPKINYFDKIIALEILEHLENDEEVIKKMHESLKDNGSIIISVPNDHFLHIFNPVKYTQHKRHYSNKSIIKKIESGGFKITSFNLVENWSLLANVYIHLFFKYILRRQKKFGFFKNIPAKTYQRKNKRGLDIVIKAVKIN